jgi:ribosome biogenesis GTPase
LISALDTSTEHLQLASAMPADVSSASPPAVSTEILTGRVVRSQSGFFIVETTHGSVTCQISGKLKLMTQRTAEKTDHLSSDVVALNDSVTIEINGPETGMIVEIAERHNVLSRVEPGTMVGTSAEREQIILANADQVILVMAARKPDPNPRALDRWLVIAEKAEIPSILICVNKMDLVKAQKLQATFAMYQEIGYPVIYTSALTGEGIDALRAKLMDGEKVSVFTGPSGVGKSSLLNTLQPGLKLETAEVSDATAKGRHTTRFSQLIKFDAGGYVADTPGIRSIAPWDIEPGELDSYFIEMRPFIEQCKFADCSHRHEPDCAVRAAVADRLIYATRYESYKRLREELEEQYIY